MMQRRDFLKGIATAVVAPAIPAIVPLDCFAMRSTSLVLTQQEFLEGMNVLIADTILYGNPKYSPTQFTGFLPRYPV